MRADLVSLQWLTLEQALLWLANETGIQLSKQDLLSQCDAGHCAVYLSVDRLKGECPEALIDEEGNWFGTVFGVGKGQILNPRALIEAEGASEIQLYIFGEVRQIERAEAECYKGVEWVATIPQDRCHPVFKTSEVVELARIIGGIVPPLRPPKPSHLLTIAALLELLTEKGRPVYNQDSIISEIDDRYGKKSGSELRGLGDSNLKKIFADANTAMSDAKKQ
ncbi:hypothetical protein ACIGFL_23010 [Pseudomonas sp. NPDC077649]|uniref:hypothetical protein n=1 Tax=Pseudomonas sp. NPDC077649 TaxID=3364423 RepID=UPI0037C97038